MKGVKGKLLKKLKTIRQIGYPIPRQDRILQVSASDGFVDNCIVNLDVKVQTLLSSKDSEKKTVNQSCVNVQEPEIIDVSELMKDLEDEEMEFDDYIDDKENVGPLIKAKDANAPPGFKQNGSTKPSALSESEIANVKHTPLAEIDVSSFRRPDLNAGSLFDPNLLTAFELAVKEHFRNEAERRARFKETGLESNQEVNEELQSKCNQTEDIPNPIQNFEEKCPPGGSDSVILYTTSLRGIRKTFEDCNSIRFLLESFRVLFFERDVSMHMEFRDELWGTLGCRAVPPRLFIKGRHIGGAEVVLGLHEQGKLRPLFEGIPVDQSDGRCEGCAGFRFVLCFKCNGGRKLILEEDSTRCQECNENGLIVCPLCC